MQTDIFTREFNANLQMYFEKPIVDVDENHEMLSEKDLWSFKEDLQEDLAFDFNKGDIQKCKNIADIRHIARLRYAEEEGRTKGGWYEIRAAALKYIHGFYDGSIFDRIQDEQRKIGKLIRPSLLELAKALKKIGCDSDFRGPPKHKDYGNGFTSISVTIPFQWVDVCLEGFLPVVSACSYCGEEQCLQGYFVNDKGQAVGQEVADKIRWTRGNYCSPIYYCVPADLWGAKSPIEIAEQMKMLALSEEQ